MVERAPRRAASVSPQPSGARDDQASVANHAPKPANERDPDRPQREEEDNPQRTPERPRYAIIRQVQSDTRLSMRHRGRAQERQLGGMLPVGAFEDASLSDESDDFERGAADEEEEAQFESGQEEEAWMQGIGADAFVEDDNFLLSPAAAHQPARSVHATGLGAEAVADEAASCAQVAEPVKAGVAAPRTEVRLDRREAPQLGADAAPGTAQETGPEMAQPRARRPALDGMTVAGRTQLRSTGPSQASRIFSCHEPMEAWHLSSGPCLSLLLLLPSICAGT